MAVLDLPRAVPLLQKEYREGRLIPFLGAGFSKPLNLPDWGELIADMAKRLGFEPDLFPLHGDFDQLAGYFEATNDFEYLVHEMTRGFNSAESERIRKTSKTHQALAALEWHTLYTTNFDFHVEGALKDAGKPVSVLASLEDFQGSRATGGCEVIKFHGTLEKRSTIVLTEKAFFDRMALEAPADQRLRADLLSHSFLFIGYSFSDTNIRYIWHRMHQLRQGSHPGARPRKCFFATHGAGPVQPTLLEKWNIDIIQLDPSDKSASVAELLQRIGA